MMKNLVYTPLAHHLEQAKISPPVVPNMGHVSDHQTWQSYFEVTSFVYVSESVCRSMHASHIPSFNKAPE